MNLFFTEKFGLHVGHLCCVYIFTPSFFNIEWWPTLHSFCIGLEGAPDLAASAEVAKFLGTVHHQFHFTVQEGLDALRDVINHLETYDVTTVSYLLSLLFTLLNGSFHLLLKRKFAFILIDDIYLSTPH